MTVFVKIPLLLIVFLSAVLTAFGSVWDFSKKVKYHESLLLLTEHIRNNIKYRALPLGEIYSSFENKFLEECGFLPFLRNGKSLEKSVTCFSAKYGVDKSVSESLAAFASSLGTKCAEAEILSADYITIVLKRECDILKAELPKKIRFNGRIGICVGLMLVTVLI